MQILFTLVLLCYGVGNVCSKVHENSTDLHALLDFKMGVTIDPSGALNSWNTSIHYCKWKYVTCTQERPWRVSGLDLNGLSLQGQISSSLGNLSFLNCLDLSNNSFVGPFPILNRLHQLQRLYLNNNFLRGNIPVELTNCTSLTNLDLSVNKLHGAIPMNISLLSNLIGLSLFTNNLTGTIPPGLGHITTLQGLYLDENKLEGRIPNEIWQLPNIVELLLGQNQLSDGIPQNLPIMFNLTKLGLEFNRLGNTLPLNIGDALPNIQLLTMNSNMFNGHIPTSIGNALGLQRLDLSSNSFTGQVPTSLGNLSNLTFLNLEGNNLEANDSESWEFVNALGTCHSLQVFSLADNQLQGAVPNSIGRLPNSLQQLKLGGNKLSGMFPSSIRNLQGLIALALDGNNFNGTIGEWVDKLTNLQHLNLEANKFTGIIPPSIGNLKKLTELSLGQNEFIGVVPPSLGNLSPLLNLNLSYNNFQEGIPSELGNLEQLTALDLSSNKFSGEIPETLSQCQNLAILRLDQNILTGNISTTFGNLKGLMVLNLSNNYLSGTIPASLSDLKLLTTLDLSYNRLHGDVPRDGVFENGTIVSLGGNSGLCGGAMDLHMPSCHDDSRRVESTLVRVLIPIFGFMSLILLVYPLFIMRRQQKKAYLSLDSFGENFPKVSYADLAQATKNFSEANLIGRGSCGSVYKGTLKETKMEVAVKVFNLEMRGAERSFMSECEALRSIQHRNLLPIITACSTVDNNGDVFKALIYEFMPNGNLDTWLHHKGDGKHPKPLSLNQRISIAVNIADALDYIHHDCGRPTVHCDLKPSNILLDDDMNALIGDFGISCFYPDSWSVSTGSTTSVGVKGTIGYIAPEYGGGGHPSTSGDVYSFGIMLLEIMTGKRPTDDNFKDGLHIVNFVEDKFPDQIYNVIDDHLMVECTNIDQEKGVQEKGEVYQCVVSLLQIALSCTCPLPHERLNMKKVASKMHAIKASYLLEKDKYASKE